MNHLHVVLFPRHYLLVNWFRCCWISVAVLFFFICLLFRFCLVFFLLLVGSFRKWVKTDRGERVLVYALCKLQIFGFDSGCVSVRGKLGGKLGSTLYILQRRRQRDTDTDTNHSPIAAFSATTWDSAWDVCTPTRFHSDWSLATSDHPRHDRDEFVKLRQVSVSAAPRCAIRWDAERESKREHQDRTKIWVGLKAF